MQKIFAIILLTILFSACSPTVQYVGKTYTPTTNVDIFLDTHDIKRDYEVIGKTDGISGVFGSTFDEIQSKIIDEAKKRGADAVIIYNMEQRIIGTTSTSSTSWDNKVSNHRQWYDKVLASAQGSSSTASSTSNITQNVLHTDFIKYLNVQ